MKTMRPQFTSLKKFPQYTTELRTIERQNLIVIVDIVSIQWLVLLNRIY